MDSVKKIFRVKEKEATLYATDAENRPLIVLNNFHGDGSPVMEAVVNLDDKAEFNLLSIGNLNWGHDMTPWYAPPLSKDDTPCTGGADDYLRLLVSEILPEAKTMIRGTPSFTAIAGYSLAGLFALYSMYVCEEFDRVASMSGSLWFPDFKEYVFEHGFKKKPEKIYMSLGDAEAKTRNPVLSTVQDNSEKIAAFYREEGFDVTWELNPGNHFKDAALRSAKGILAIL